MIEKQQSVQSISKPDNLMSSKLIFNLYDQYEDQIKLINEDEERQKERRRQMVQEKRVEQNKNLNLKAVRSVVDEFVDKANFVDAQNEYEANLRDAVDTSSVKDYH